MSNYPIDCGTAVYMGDGVFVLCQDSDDGPHSVAITVPEMKQLLAALG